MTSRLLIVSFCVMIAPAITSDLLADGSPAKEHRAAQTPPIELGTSGSLSTEARRGTGMGGRCGAFTLGSAVTCDGRFHILGTNYALATLDDSGNPAIPGTPVLQPGNRDTNCRATGTPVAVFESDYAPLLNNPAATVDAAIVAALPGAVDPDGAILDLGVICADVVDPAVGMLVVMSGRSSGLTGGFVETVDTTLNYRGPGINTTFTNVLVIEGASQFTKAGDDGALVVTDDANHNPVGLLFYPGSGYAFANSARGVVSAFAGACGHDGLAWVGRRDCGAPLTAAVSSIGAPAEGLVRAAEVKARHAGRLLEDPAIFAVGIGMDDRDRTRPAIHVYRDVMRTPFREIPADLEGIPVSVRVTEAPARGR